MRANAGQPMWTLTAKDKSRLINKFIIFTYSKHTSSQNRNTKEMEPNLQFLRSVNLQQHKMWTFEFICEIREMKL